MHAGNGIAISGVIPVLEARRDKDRFSGRKRLVKEIEVGQVATSEGDGSQYQSVGVPGEFTGLIERFPADGTEWFFERCGGAQGPGDLGIFVPVVQYPAGQGISA